MKNKKLGTHSNRRVLLMTSLMTYKWNSNLLPGGFQHRFQMLHAF